MSYQQSRFWRCAISSEVVDVVCWLGTNGTQNLGFCVFYAAALERTILVVSLDNPSVSSTGGCPGTGSHGILYVLLAAGISRHLVSGRYALDPVAVHYCPAASSGAGAGVR